MKRICAIILSLVLLVQVSSVAVSAQEEIPFEIYRMVESEPSEYGYINYKYVNEKGEEIISEENRTIGDDMGLEKVDENLCYAPNIPSSYDLRDYGYVTSVKSQGSTGNCWAFGCISALESNSIMHGNSEYSETDFSEAHLVWFSKNSQSTDVNDMNYGEGYIVENPYTGSDSGGNTTYVVSALSRWSGLAKESDYRFYPYSYSQMGNYDESVRYDKNSGVVMKSAEDIVDAADVKQWIMENGAVTATYYNDKQMYNTTTYAYNYTTEKVSNHMISIVGWDDNYSIDNFLSESAPKNNGAWLCKNSWGSSWGNDGFFWISYEDATLKDFVGFTTQKADDFTNNYTYNGRGYMSQMTLGTEPQYANVFKAKNYEAVTEVATYILQPDTDVTVSIYKDLPEDYATPVGGSLVATHKVKIDKSGYHTIHLPEEVLLEPGTIFSVVIKLENETVKPVVAFEDSEKNGFTYNEGESFVCSSSVGKWYDVTRYQMLGISNVCVQALTKCVYEQESRMYVNFNKNLLIAPYNDFSYLKDNIDIFKDSAFLVEDIYKNNISVLATGSTLTVAQSNGETLKFTVVVEGDLNGDGVCDVLDASETDKIVNGHKISDELQCYAANGCVAENIDISTYQKVVNKALSG